MIKKIIDFLKPILKGWTIQGMIKILEQEGYEIKKR